MEEKWKNSTSVEVAVITNESIAISSVGCIDSRGRDCNQDYLVTENNPGEVSVILHNLTPAELHTITLTLDINNGTGYIKEINVCMGECK